MVLRKPSRTPHVLVVALLAMSAGAQEPAVVSCPVADLWADARTVDPVDLVTQVVLGETVLLTGEAVQDRLRVLVPSQGTRLDFRGYPGWIHRSHLVHGSYRPGYIVTTIDARLAVEGELLLLSCGSRLRLAMAEVHVMAGDASSALGVLDGMDASQAPAWQLETLRGRALVALGRWEEARATLDEALKLNPDPARAHYFLGRVLAHQGEWPGAAKHYRAAFEHAPAAGALATHELADGGRQE